MNEVEHLVGRAGLNGADDHILPALVTAPALIEHAKALAHAGGVAEKNLQAAAALKILFRSAQMLEQLLGRRAGLCGNTHASIIGDRALLLQSVALVQGQVGVQYVYASFPKKAQIAAVSCGVKYVQDVL